MCKPRLAEMLAVYSFPPSVPEAPPSPEPPAQSSPKANASDGPPPSTPLPPLVNNTAPGTTTNDSDPLALADGNSNATIAAASAIAPAPVMPSAPAAAVAASVSPAAAQPPLPDQTSVLANATLVTSLQPDSTALATAVPILTPAVTAVAQNLSAVPLIQTQDGMMYDLKGMASNGSCLTLWQLIQLSPNLTSWGNIIQVLSHANNTATTLSQHCVRLP